MNTQDSLAKENKRLSEENRKLLERKEALKASLNSYKNKLRIAELSIDFNFKKVANSYIKEQIIPRANRVKAPDYFGAIIEKSFVRKFEPFKGMTPYQLFYLELDCLGRINETTLGDGKSHFPRLVDFDAKKLTIRFSDNGQSLNKLKEKVRVQGVNCQLDYIFRTLDVAGIIHLDMHPAGTNISINEDGIISIIDFDLAKVGDLSFNYTIDDILKSNKIVTTRELVYSILKQNKFIDLV